MSTRQLKVSMGRAIVSCILLFLIFSAPPIGLPKGSNGKDLLNQFRFYKADSELRRLDVEKVSNEIAMRIEQENEWYRYKFLFVGSLLLVSVVHLSGFARMRPLYGEMQPGEGRLLQLVQSHATLTVLSVATTIALAIDTHMRVGVTSSNIAGLFLYSNGCSDWEWFLRATGMMHTDVPYMLIYWPHFHFLTLVMYGLYVVGFQYAASSTELRNGWLLMAGYALVHIAIFFFTFAAHLAPGALRIVPFDMQFRPWVVLGFFVLLSILMLIPSFPYWCRLWRSSRD